MVGFLEGWLAGKALKKTRRRLREKLGDVAGEEHTSMIDMAPAQGARWLQHPDGTWKRWSYLGESWEPVAEPPAPFPRTDAPPSPVEWILQPDGTWERTAPE